MGLSEKHREIAARFIRYAKIDTQSDFNSNTVPSTEKQKNLGKLLVSELQEMGISAELDDKGYVYATIPSNTDKDVPVICFCAHMDTSPDCSGKDVKPVIHENYQGEDLVLPDDTSVVLRASEHPDLPAQAGNHIITASGTTLLGADNKAGVTAIMEAAIAMVRQGPEIEHGTIKLLFTPDEEIGRGVDHADLEKLGADYAYTVDGEMLGSIEDETFSADGATLIIEGISAHPGFAKGKMESAIRILSEIINEIPLSRSPEGTSGKEGFIHPVGFSGSVERAEANFILRDFDNGLLKGHAAYLETITQQVLKKYPNSTYSIEVKEQYRNMKMVLDNHPTVVAYGIEAIRRAGLTPLKQSIRGGTDGTRLSFMGLPCPNIFAGEHAFHGKEEWVSIQDMEKATETIVNIAKIWAEKAGR